MKSRADVLFGLQVQEELAAKCRNLVILKFQTPLLCLLQLWLGAETTNCLQWRTKSSDFTRLNRLGICMSHDQTIKKQVEMGKSYNAKILLWKQEVESRELSKKILSEVIEKQSDETVVDMSRATLQDYSNFFFQRF